jgi:hypothetical protein
MVTVDPGDAALSHGEDRIPHEGTVAEAPDVAFDTRIVSVKEARSCSSDRIAPARTSRAIRSRMGPLSRSSRDNVSALVSRIMPGSITVASAAAEAAPSFSQSTAIGSPA